MFEQQFGADSPLVRTVGPRSPPSGGSGGVRVLRQRASPPRRELHIHEGASPVGASSTAQRMTTVTPRRTVSVVSPPREGPSPADVRRSLPVAQGSVAARPSSSASPQSDPVVPQRPSAMTTVSPLRAASPPAAVSKSVLQRVVSEAISMEQQNRRLVAELQRSAPDRLGQAPGRAVGGTNTPTEATRPALRPRSTSPVERKTQTAPSNSIQRQRTSSPPSHKGAMDRSSPGRLSAPRPATAHVVSSRGQVKSLLSTSPQRSPPQRPSPQRSPPQHSALPSRRLPAPSTSLYAAPTTTVPRRVSPTRPPSDVAVVEVRRTRSPDRVSQPVPSQRSSLASALHADRSSPLRAAPRNPSPPQRSPIRTHVLPATTPGPRVSSPDRRAAPPPQPSPVSLRLAAGYGEGRGAALPRPRSPVAVQRARSPSPETSPLRAAGLSTFDRRDSFSRKHVPAPRAQLLPGERRFEQARAEVSPPAPASWRREEHVPREEQIRRLQDRFAAR